MHFELGQENFQSSITSASVNHIQVQIQSKFKCDDLGIKCQSFTIEIKFKCQYINDHYQLLVQLHSIIAQSTLK